MLGQLFIYFIYYLNWDPWWSPDIQVTRHLQISCSLDCLVDWSLTSYGNSLLFSRRVYQ